MQLFETEINHSYNNMLGIIPPVKSGEGGVYAALLIP